MTKATSLGGTIPGILPCGSTPRGASSLPSGPFASAAPETLRLPPQVAGEEREHALYDALSHVAGVRIIPFARIVLFIDVGDPSDPQHPRELAIRLHIWIRCVTVELKSSQCAQVRCVRLHECYGIVR